tara:strand:+ start:791 stop:1543 length:753 start_codon:yes stop_codon:yes gene_type:complete
MTFKPVDYHNTKRGKLLLIYGPPGAGKSTFAARMAAAKEEGDAFAVVLDLEIGITEALKEAKGNSKLFDLSDPSPTMANDMTSFLRSIRNRDDVNMVVLDTLSELSWSILQGLCGMKDPTLKIYGDRKKQLRVILMELRNLAKVGKDIIVLTHETIGEVEGLPGHYAPACPNRDRADIVGIFDLVGRLCVATKSVAASTELSPGEHYINLIKDPQHVSKCRYRIFNDDELAVVSVETTEDVANFIKKLKQ